MDFRWGRMPGLGWAMAPPPEQVLLVPKGWWELRAPTVPPSVRPAMGSGCLRTQRNFLSTLTMRLNQLQPSWAKTRWRRVSLQARCQFR